MVQCIGQYVASIGDMGKVSMNYSRNTAVSSSTFYYPITKEYDIDLYMDSTTGVDPDNDDKRRQLTDRAYRVFLRWCADGTTLKATEDNTMQVVVYHSGESYTQDMLKQRSVILAYKQIYLHLCYVHRLTFHSQLQEYHHSDSHHTNICL